MIQRIAKPGRSFRKALAYDLRDDRIPELVGSNMAGEEIDSLAAEFAEVRWLRDDLSKPVFRASLSLAPGERLSSGAWRALSGDYLHALGYEQAPWVAIRHRNTRLDHVHLVASRVDFQGWRIDPSFELPRGLATSQELSRRYGLTAVGPGSENRAPSRGDLARFERSGQVAIKDRLAEHVRLAARDRPTLGEFVARLAAQGVEIRIRPGEDGEPQGVSFSLDGVACRGGSLGRAMTWRGLQRALGCAMSGRAMPRPCGARSALDLPESA